MVNCNLPRTSKIRIRALQWFPFAIFVSLPPPTTFSIKLSCRKGLEICQLLTVLLDQLIPSGSHSLHTPERPLQWRNKAEHGISCSVQSCQSFLCCQSSSNYLGLTDDDTLPPESVRLPCRIHPFSKNKLTTALLKRLFPKELVQKKQLPRSLQQNLPSYSLISISTPSSQNCSPLFCIWSKCILIAR